MQPKEIIKLQDYWKGRDIKYVKELNEEIVSNAIDLLERVNSLLYTMHVINVTITSGWRPKEINEMYGGAPGSLHLVGKAIDLSDVDKRLSKEIEERAWLLKEYGLWMEDPKQTKTWVHLDTGQRFDRDVRIFKIR